MVGGDGGVVGLTESDIMMEVDGLTREVAIVGWDGGVVGQTEPDIMMEVDGLIREVAMEVGSEHVGMVWIWCIFLLTGIHICCFTHTIVWFYVFRWHGNLTSSTRHCSQQLCSFNKMAAIFVEQKWSLHIGEWEPWSWNSIPPSFWIHHLPGPSTK